MRKSKSLYRFIREHRAELDQVILRSLYRGEIPAKRKRLNDHKRRDWILNHEGLYNWARSEGVQI